MQTSVPKRMMAVCMIVVKTPYGIWYAGRNVKVKPLSIGANFSVSELSTCSPLNFVWFVCGAVVVTGHMIAEVSVYRRFIR